jgi:type IV pilus assembly protein PilV
MNRPPMRKPARELLNRPRQHGFTLVEVLVAALVLAIGLLGLAGLQAVSVKANHGAYLRSQASNLAYEITDAMRANRDVALAGTYNRALSDATPATSATLAINDLSTWLNHLQQTLPGGQGAVQVNNAGLATVTIRWDSSRDLESTATTDFIFGTRL